MRLIGGFLLVLITVAYTHGQFSGIQLNNLQSLLSYSSQVQGLINQLNTVLPQLSNILSSTQVQSLRDQIVGLVLSQAANHPTIDGLKDMLRPLLQQYIGTSTQGRVDFDGLLQQIAGIAGSVLPGLLIGLIGKRDVASVQDRTLEQLLALEPGKLSQLQSQLTSLVLQGASNYWSATTMAQAIQQLFTQYVPSLSTARIDWEQVGQSALNGLVSAIPGVLVGLVSLIGKRDVASVQDRTLEQLLALEPGKLSQLQTQLASLVLQGASNNWSSTAIAQAIQQLFTQYVPSLSTARIDWEQVGQSALNGLVSAIPGVLVGLVSLIGKRDVVSVQDRTLEQLLALEPAKLSQLQTQLASLVLQGASNNWSSSAIAQAIQQLFTQYVPSLSTARIDWEQVGQSALNGLVSAIPGVLVGLVSLIGKRDTSFDLQQILSILPIDKIIQLIQAATYSDKFTALTRLRDLFRQFLPSYSVRVNFDDLATSFFNQLNNIIPNLNQSIINAIIG